MDSLWSKELLHEYLRATLAMVGLCKVFVDASEKFLTLDQLEFFIKNLMQAAVALLKSISAGCLFFLERDSIPWSRRTPRSCLEDLYDQHPLTLPEI